MCDAENGTRNTGMSHFQYKGSNIFYEDRGSGDCLLYVHEWNGSSLSFRKFNLKHLVNDARVICIDLPGYGDSGYPDDLEFDDFSLILAGVLDHLAIGKCTLMGFCLGSAIILDFYLKFPDRVRSMILIEPVIKFPMILIPLLIPRFGTRFLEYLSKSRLLFSLVGHWVVGGGKSASTFVFKSIGKCDPVISHRYLQLMYRKHRLDERSAQYADLQNMAVCITGKKTNRIFRTNLSYVKRRFNIHACFNIDDSRHFVMIEQPEQFLKIIQGYMKRD